MEPTTQEQEPQHQQPQPHTWREESAESQNNPEVEKHRRRIIEKVGIKFPKYTMTAKLNMLNDLRSSFKARPSDHHGDCCEGRIKDRFHFVKKKEPHNRTLKKKNSYLRLLNRAKVDDLVSQMKSPCFGIQADRNEFDLNRGVHTFSFFDKTPREPLPQIDISEDNSDISEDISQESRPDATEKLEHCSINSNSHKISAMKYMQE